MQYTYKIGLSDQGNGLSVVSHSVEIVAATFAEAIDKARDELASAPTWERADRIVLVDKTGVVWKYDIPDA